MPFTPALILLRHSIIFWLTVALIPVEIVFDGIEAELERRGVTP